jgi:hypothetical protein
MAGYRRQPNLMGLVTRQKKKKGEKKKATYFPSKKVKQNNRW